MLREDWTATAEPCRSLAKAYQLAGGEGGLAGGEGGLGPTDAERPRLCAYWRGFSGGPDVFSPGFE
jgi:hypothetical protein